MSEKIEQIVVSSRKTSMPIKYFFPLTIIVYRSRSGVILNRGLVKFNFDYDISFENFIQKYGDECIEYDHRRSEMNVTLYDTWVGKYILIEDVDDEHVSYLEYNFDSYAKVT